MTNDNRMSTVSTPTPDATLGVVPGVSEGLAALSTGSVPVGRKDGFIGGGQVGYNWVSGRFLAGLEADIQGISNTTAAGTLANTAVVVGTPIVSSQIGSMSTSDLGTVRGRVGLLADPKWLLYVTGGLAYGNVSATNILTQTGTNGFIGAGTASSTDTRSGWTAGGGVEWMIAPMWSVKAEYLHYDLGSVRFVNGVTGTPASAFFAGQVFQTNSVSASFRGDIVRAGVNYHFGGPVVAKY
jgi:outer membrane immunogenic protein